MGENRFDKFKKKKIKSQDWLKNIDDSLLDKIFRKV